MQISIIKCNSVHESTADVRSSFSSCVSPSNKLSMSVNSLLSPNGPLLAVFSLLKTQPSTNQVISSQFNNCMQLQNTHSTTTEREWKEIFYHKECPEMVLLAWCSCTVSFFPGTTTTPLTTRECDLNYHHNKHVTNDQVSILLLTKFRGKSLL